MSKAILMSINPRWCELIARGEKTIEVRKTFPQNLRPPFKVYIYMTAGNASYPVTINGAPYTCSNNGGKVVIGEFMCKEIDRISRRGMNNNFDYCYLSLKEFGNDDIEIEIRDVKKSCVSKEELNSYSANSPFLYAWHISDLVIYDQPKELSEFYRKCEDYPACDDCEFCSWTIEEGCECVCAYEKPLKRPPQSWCYVEEVEHHD